MDLLRRSELPAWLQARFGSASELAAKMNVTRQTAHNLMTGRTIPSYETCEKLGLDPVFMLRTAEERRKMSTLDDFLAQRERERQHQGGAARILSEKGPRMWDQLQEATWSTAGRIGNIDGNDFEWNPYPFLKLQYVAATFTPGTLVRGEPKGCRIIFGRIPTALYVDDNPLPTRVWDLKVSVSGNELLWDVNGEEIMSAAHVELAGQSSDNWSSTGTSTKMRALGRYSRGTTSPSFATIDKNRRPCSITTFLSKRANSCSAFNG